MIAIIEYGMGNVRSVYNAFRLLAPDVAITANSNDLRKADKIILPGVGAFGIGMKNLYSSGFVEALNSEVLVNKKPFLGICLGMQLLAKSSLEFGLHQGLSWIDASVVPFKTDGPLKVPHVGWNNIEITKPSGLLDGIRNGSDCYFVHSYYMDCQERDAVIATCGYDVTFTAAVQKGNIFATQFHPEKSQTVGLKIIQNFLSI